MIKVLLLDFSRVLLHPKDKSYQGGLNDLHKKLSRDSSYKIFDHFELNEELIKFLSKLRERFYLCIFTTELIQEDPAIQEKIKPIFDKVYSAKYLGFGKTNSKSYKLILKDLKALPEEVFFIDDTMENLKAAQQAGLQAYKYSSNQEVFQLIERL
ncbi:HAD-IA family hydrolase [Candidatus Daviesbacteria bacterium]|nr:HAD-IA family hydrolase [Candidatus Daviesbacteria bacterium]